MDSVFHRGGFGHGSDNFFKTLTRPLVMGGFMSATLRLSSVSAPSARRTRAARAHAAASTRSCPPREFQAVSGTARGPALALGAEPRWLGPWEAEARRAREPSDASCKCVVHEAGMRVPGAAA